ncbi:unnamed protein product [Musa hybrid cultivar]
MSEAPASNNNMEKTSSELPPDLFMEILSWIPARALLKLRCVRKHWYSMTTDPVFIRFHLQRQQLLPQVTSVLTFHKRLNDGAALSLLDVVDAPWAAKHVAVWDNHPLLNISSPCHGLICLYHIYMEPDVCLYNPATRKSFSLPQNFTSEDILLSAFCLGYHPISRQYKVIHVFYTRSNGLGMEVLTVGGSTWRKVEVSSARTTFTSIKMGRPSATGTMYWLALRQGTLEDIILSVDLDDERLIEVPLPQTERHHEGGHKSLTELEGTIHLVSHWFAKANWMDIWMLRESGAHRLWIHRFHLRLCALPRGVRPMERELHIICLIPSDSEPGKPSPPERSCKPVSSAAFRFPQSTVYCPTIMICYAVSGREGEERAAGPSNPWRSRMRTNEVAGNRLWGILASMVRMMPDLLGYEQKDAKTFVLWEKGITSLVLEKSDKL